MLGVNIDITPLLDPGAFQRYYTFRDSQKDKALEDIRTKENRYQTFGLVSSVPFLLASVSQKVPARPPPNRWLQMVLRAGAVRSHEEPASR